MTVLADTDVLVAFLNSREERHKQAAHLVGKILEGQWGAPMVTDFVLDEALTLLMARGVAPAAADRLLGLMLVPAAPGGSPALPLVRVSDAAFGAAIPLFRRHYKKRMSFTDCTSLAVLAERRVDVIASFDRGFDGLAARVES